MKREDMEQLNFWLAAVSGTFLHCPDRALKNAIIIVVPQQI